eukprot:TRINITY_DN2738_c0_g2_i1.p1 TRINITY_DN2738_c0_g2~~TRINITY_DN2738_c0_g2_i1.p1  ORF type:complete len:228 (-),score=52.29 TRINITY_DN2738_c0_g2_i1:4-687(-)
MCIRDRKKAKKKEEQAHLAAEVKAIEIKRQFLNADAAKVEELKWLQLEKGAEREVRDKQRVHHQEAVRAEKLKEKEAVQKARNVRTEMRNKQKLLVEFDRRMQVSAAKDAESRKAKEQSKIARAKIQRAEEIAQHKIHEQRPVNGLSNTIQAGNRKLAPTDKTLTRPDKTVKLSSKPNQKSSNLDPTQKLGSRSRPGSGGSTRRSNEGVQQTMVMPKAGTLPGARYD